MLVAVFLYFLLGTVLLAFWLLPSVRDHALGWVQRLMAESHAMRRRATEQGRVGAGLIGAAVHGASTRSASWVSRHRRGLIGAAVVLPMAPLVPIALRGFLRLDGYDHRMSRGVDEKVAALLEGEQLVPPPPVPPELFMAPEVERSQPLVRDASRQWELLDSDFRQRLLIVFRLMHERHGYDLVLVEGYRSPERQAKLAALGPQVTRAGPCESYHQLGLAADCAFLRNDRIVISEKDAYAARGYVLYGEVARSVGFAWGGDWNSIKDLGHVELRRDARQGAPGQSMVGSRESAKARFVAGCKARAELVEPVLATLRHAVRRARHAARAAQALVILSRVSRRLCCRGGPAFRAAAQPRVAWSTEVANP